MLNVQKTKIHIFNCFDKKRYFCKYCIIYVLYMKNLKQIYYLPSHYNPVFDPLCIGFCCEYNHNPIFETSSRNELEKF